MEYTYVRTNFGSRIDRCYVKDLVNNIQYVKNINVHFSDHSCVSTDFNLIDIPKRGKGYWKLNTQLLDDENIKKGFETEWKRICLNKNRFKDINEWWDIYVKKEITFYFIKKGKEMAEKKYGLIQYLEFCLNKLYYNVNLTGNLQYNEVKTLKDRINELKNDILEGVKIRCRLKEQIEGERVSSFLIKQQAGVKSRKLISTIKTEEGIMENLGPNVILNNKDSISMYIKNYYEKLYTNERYDEEDQEWFLQYVSKCLTSNEQILLESVVTQKELFETIKDMNLNKAPGIDGIPIEFYLKYWNIIKKEIIEVIRNNVKGTLLNDKQRKAIITLLPKDGDQSMLKSWRPVSLICCDVKIVAKILANRLKPLIYSLVSENQFCVQGRSIVECNSKIRDFVYYAGKNNITGAVINIDWEKAFDRVNWVFLFKILKKMKFPESTIKWIKIFYTNIQSTCLINGYFTDSFEVCRGVRQGCPLSMLLFVIFQDPLYIAMEKANNIRPIEIPGRKVLEVGYADDTNVITGDDSSFIEIFNMLNRFRKATNSKLNIKKTKVYGFGNWSKRLNCPVSDVGVEVEYFFTLGMLFSTNYDISICHENLLT